MVWSQGGVDYTASPFPEHNVLEALLYLLLTRVIWSSHADLSGSGPHKLIAVFKHTEQALPVGGSVTQHVNNQPP